MPSPPAAFGTVTSTASTPPSLTLPLLNESGGCDSAYPRPPSARSTVTTRPFAEREQSQQHG